MGYTAYHYIEPYMVTPLTALEEARLLAGSGKYTEASDAFERYLQQYPDSPDKAEAQFQAAYCALIAPTSSFDEESTNMKRALALFQKFLQDNPSHTKAMRVRTLMGHINFRLRHFSEAIDLLRDPMLRLRDPEAALPALRSLARAYTQLGDYAAAESAYEQAASMSGNYTSDVDYDELGDLCKLRADRATTDNERKQMQAKAIENWNYAMRVPSIDPANKAKIQAKRDWLQNHPGSETEKPTTEKNTTQTEPQSPSTAAQTEPTSPTPPEQPSTTTLPTAENKPEAATPSSGETTPTAATPPQEAKPTESTAESTPNPAAEARFLNTEPPAQTKKKPAPAKAKK